MGKFSSLINKFIDYEYIYDRDDDSEERVGEYMDYDSEEIPYGYDEGQSEQPPINPEPTPIVPPTPAATVVMLTPYDIRTSQIVCDHVRMGHIVICNLTPNANNQRVVDYISGAVYAFEGKIEPTPVKTTFVCTPKTVDLLIDTAVPAEDHEAKVSAL